MQQNPTDNTIIVKKYPNRRLYDTASRRYVNLDDLAGMVRKGLDVQVVDARTGEDLTRTVLMQIIMEEDKNQPGGLPLEVLRHLIMATDRAGRDFTAWYLKSAFDAFEKVQQTVRSAAFSPVNVVKNMLARPEESELEQLRQRVADLEARLERRSSRKKKV